MQIFGCLRRAGHSHLGHVCPERTVGRQHPELLLQLHGVDGRAADDFHSQEPGPAAGREGLWGPQAHDYGRPEASSA